MAIDSARKRRNAAGVTFPSTVAVTPDASEGVEWRASVAWGYYFAVTFTELVPAARHTLGPTDTIRYLGATDTVRYLGRT